MRAHAGPCDYNNLRALGQGDYRAGWLTLFRPHSANPARRDYGTSHRSAAGLSSHVYMTHGIATSSTSSSSSSHPLAFWCVCVCVCVHLFANNPLHPYVPCALISLYATTGLSARRSAARGLIWMLFGMCCARVRTRVCVCFR